MLGAMPSDSALKIPDRSQIAAATTTTTAVIQRQTDLGIEIAMEIACFSQEFGRICSNWISNWKIIAENQVE